MKFLMICFSFMSITANAWLGGQISNGASNEQICTKTVGTRVLTCTGKDVTTYQSGGKPYCSCPDKFIKSELLNQTRIKEKVSD